MTTDELLEQKAANRRIRASERILMTRTAKDRCSPRRMATVDERPARLTVDVAKKKTGWKEVFTSTHVHNAIPAIQNELGRASVESRHLLG